MSRQTFSYPPVPMPRQSANHGTSSAFSSSANPDEDWTQISDLAERRRIQNRIAQRNYRKKLKRRLEDLERRAGSSSVSPPQAHAQIKQTPRKTESNSYKPAAAINQVNTQNIRQKMVPRVLPHNQYTPPMQSDDDVIFNNSFDRDGSHTPPLFGYHHTYSAPEENIYQSYAGSDSYRPIGTCGDAYPEYLATAPMTLPSMMHFAEGIKREPMTGSDSLNPFSMSYAAMAGIDIPGSNSFDDSNPHTPPLSHSFENSAACSEAAFPTYPHTPLSMPPSPRPLRL